MIMTDTQKEINTKINRFYRTGNIQRAIETCQLALLNDTNNANLHVRLGDLYLEWHLDIYQARQYVDEAITEYQRALEILIDSPEIFYKIGLAFFYKNELDKAINYFELAIEHNKKMHKSYYMIALTYMKKYKMTEAIEYAEKSIKIAPLFSSRAYFLVFNILRAISFKNAKTVLKAGIAVILSIITLPFDGEAVKTVLQKISYLQFLPVLVQGIIKSQTKGIDEALEIYRKAIEKAPGFVFLYCLIGQIYCALGRYEDAICEYKMAIWLDSLNITAYRSLCQLYEEMQDYDSLAELYTRLIGIQPYSTENHCNLAFTMYQKGDVQEAINHYQNAITLNQNVANTSYIARDLGCLFQEDMQNLDAAISSYQIACSLTPRNIEIYINLGSAFYEKGEYDNALTVYRRAIELEPNNAKIYCNLGYLHWGKGNTEEAIKSYELAIKYNKEYDIAYNNLGVIYLDDLGRVQKSIELFEKAIKYKHNYALAYYNLARATSISGDKIEAAKLYQIALDLNSVTNELDPQEIHDKIQDLFS